MFKALIAPILLGGLFVLISLGLPHSVETQKELKAIQFGLPIPFVIQDASAQVRALPSPVWIGLPGNTPTEIVWERLVGSWFIVSFVIVIVQQVIFGGRASYSA